jgi:hypothetical protein
MSKTLFANASGVIIYEGDETQLSQMANLSDDADLSVPGALTAIQKLGYLYFHSGYSYLGNATKATISITHPARTASSAASGGKHSGVVYSLTQGTATYNLLTHTSGVDAPNVVKLDDAQLLNGIPVQSVGASYRAVSTYNTGTQIVLYETYMTHASSLPAITKTYTAYVFEFLSASTASGATNSLEITGTSLKGGQDKLDTAYNYIRRESTNPDFYLIRDKTADVYRGKLKAIAPSGKVTYNPEMPNPAWTYRINNDVPNAIVHPASGNPVYIGTFGGASTTEGTTISGWPAAGNGTGVLI